MRLPWRRRVTEATDEQLIATGAATNVGYDPIDHDRGWTKVGVQGRPVPGWTLEKLRSHSIASYRSNPMARAIIDTYTSFCVGDSGLTLQVTSDEVRPVAEKFWNDPRNRMGDQDVALRSHLLNGETCYELMTGETTGVVRRSVIDPARITGVGLDRGNPLWPSVVRIGQGFGAGADLELAVIQIDDLTGLRTGECVFWASFRALETDVRGDPFLSPVIDWLDNYDQVLSNLIDRTALARHLAFDVTLKGNDVGPKEIEDFIQRRGGTHVPRSGSIEVHNESVEWNELSATTGADEDKTTAGSIMTSVAAGAGLAKTWLAEPEDANRATSLTMAEPVRRRVGGVQNLWIGYQLELPRYAVDRAVAAGRLPAEVEVQAEGEQSRMVPAADTVKLVGPEIAAADAAMNAEMLKNLSLALGALVDKQILSPEAAQVAAKKAWEDFVGVPYTADLDNREATDTEKLAEHIDENTPALQAV